MLQDIVFPLILKDQKGHSLAFDSFELLDRFLVRFEEDAIGLDFRKSGMGTEGPFYSPTRWGGLREYYTTVHRVLNPPEFHRFILRDAVGNAIDPKDLRNLLHAEKMQRYRERMNRYNKANPRRNSGGSSWGRGSYYRKVKTLRAMKQASIREDVPPPRITVAHIPDSWDDIHRNSQRSWKKHRKTQYKM